MKAYKSRWLGDTSPSALGLLFVIDDVLEDDHVVTRDTGSNILLLWLKGASFGQSEAFHSELELFLFFHDGAERAAFFNSATLCSGLVNVGFGLVAVSTQ